MISLISNLAAVVCGVLLATTGAGKLFGRQTARLAANTVLVRVLNDGRRATLALRTVGAVELAIAAALLAVPTTVVPGVATAVLGAGFTAYLGYAKATAPKSSCGCSARDEGPIGWRAFTRAGLVVVGGLAAAPAHTAWWSQISRHPATSAVFVVVAAAVLLGLSTDVDRLWLMPLRKLRIRVFGNPLTGSGEHVPVVASVELLEHSLAWVAAAPIVRSALLDHWDDDGWRILRFAGVYEDEHGARPVNVLFALDLVSTIDTAPSPAVRVTVVDDRTDEVVPIDLLGGSPPRTVLPLAN